MSEGVFFLTAKGQRLPPEVEQQAYYFEFETAEDRLARAEVRFKEGAKIADKGIFAQGDVLGVSFGSGTNLYKETLRIHRAGGGHDFRVIAYEEAHDLQRVSRSRIWAAVTYSEIASQIARIYGFGTDIEPTKYRHPQVAQVNESDLHFLRRLARRIGFECYVENKVLHFHRRRWEAGPVDTLTYIPGGGGTLTEFYPNESTLARPGRVTAAGINPWTRQPFEVHIDDRTAQRTVTGPATFQDNYPAGATGYRLAVAHHDQQAAREEAEGLYRLLQDDLVLAEFVAVGNPRIQARAIVEVHGYGARWDGLYRVRSARHIIAGQYIVRGWLVRNAAASGGLLKATAAKRNTQRAPTGRRLAGG